MTIEQATARCWAEIDLDALRANYEKALELLSPGAKLIPVLKADAYGLGARKLGQVLHGYGCRLFAVAAACEASELKRALPGDADILIMGMTGEAELEEVIKDNIQITVFDQSQLPGIARAAKALNKTARVQLKIETGLARLGMPADAVSACVRAILSVPLIQIEGMFTHLALRNQESDSEQFDLLNRAYEAARAAGATVPLLHACDSIGMVRYPKHHLDAVRTGAWLYGVCPYRYEHPEYCRPIARLYARVVQLHAVKAGQCVGYDSEHPLTRDSVIATLSAGYNDGYPRLAEACFVSVRGQRAPMVGLVCMDQMMADVTDIPDAAPGDIATLFGDGISIGEYASWARLNRNEALGRIGRRVPRVYTKNGETDEIILRMEEN